MSLGVDVAMLGGFAVLSVLGAWMKHMRKKHESPVVTPTEAEWEAVKRLHLSHPADNYWPVTGKVEGSSVEVAVDVDPNGGRKLSVRVIPETVVALRLLREARVRWLGGEELVLGEPRFDDVYRVETQNELETRALFDAPTRDAVAGAGSMGAEFGDGRWTLEADITGWTLPQLEKAIRTLPRVHTVLRQRLATVRADPVKSLNAVAANDRTAGVRLRCLEHLVRSGIADRDVLVLRAEDVDVNVRLLAAHALGSAGHEVLERLARTGSRTVRVRAAAHLAESNQLRPEAQVLVEDVFLAALDDPENAKLALLGLLRRGTARSVLPLRGLLDGTQLVGGEVAPSEVRTLAEGVLAAVRARLDPGASGGVSLSHAATGELALADPGDGHLSPTEP